MALAYVESTGKQDQREEGDARAGSSRGLGQWRKTATDPGWSGPSNVPELIPALAIS